MGRSGPVGVLCFWSLTHFTLKLLTRGQFRRSAWSKTARTKLSLSGWKSSKAEGDLSAELVDGRNNWWGDDDITTWWRWCSEMKQVTCENIWSCNWTSACRWRTSRPHIVLYILLSLHLHDDLTLLFPAGLMPQWQSAVSDQRGTVSGVQGRPSL